MIDDRQTDAGEPRADSHIPEPQRAQPRLTMGDRFEEEKARCKIEPLKRAAEEPLAETIPGEAVFRHLEPALDPVAASHGARKFRVKFADPEVLDALDRASASGAWYVSVHFIDNGMIHHFHKPSDKFPTADVPRVADAVAADARKRLDAIRKQAEEGLSHLPDFAAPRTMDNEED